MSVEEILNLKVKATPLAKDEISAIYYKPTGLMMNVAKENIGLIPLQILDRVDDEE